MPDGEVQVPCRERKVGTHFPAAVLKEDIDVLRILKMMRELHDVFVVQVSVQLDFIDDLEEA